jgi:hypothetical protein
MIKKENKMNGACSTNGKKEKKFIYNLGTKT